MMKIMLIGLMALCILMLGSCSTALPTPSLIVDDCVPDIEIVIKYVPLNAELTILHKLPPVPSSGDNANLLEWTMACATGNNMLNGQLSVIRELD